MPRRVNPMMLLGFIIRKGVLSFEKRILLAVFLIGFALSVSGSVGQAQTQQQVASLDPKMDNTIMQDWPTSNYGTCCVHIVDGDEPSGSGKGSSVLLKFDVSSMVPAGATIKSASLEVNVTNSSTHGFPIYALKRDWSETDSNWNDASSGEAWETAGATGANDRETTVLGTASLGSVGRGTTPLNGSGVAKVQQWLDTPSSNHGIIIAPDGTDDNDGLRFAIREVAASEPVLKVTYTEAPPPSNLFFSDTFERDADTFVPPWNRVSAGPKGSVTTDSSISRKGAYSAKFTVYEGDWSQYGSPRAQLRWGGHLCEGDERWIGYSMYLPTAFPVPSPGWMNLGQFGFGPPWGYPPLHFSDNGDGKAMNVYDQHTNRRGAVPIRLGAWNDIVLHELFSSDPSAGYVEIWKDGSPITFYNGSTRLYTNTLRDDATGCGSLEIGEYRQANVWPEGLAVWFDAVRVGSSYADVAP